MTQPPENIPASPSGDEKYAHIGGSNKVIKDITAFRKELAELINRHSMENGSDTPDFLLAEFLTNMLITFDCTVNQREAWYSRKDTPMPLERSKK